jgi:hypothetical protein
MKQAWGLVEKFAINVTGCRSGDYLVGTSVATKGGQLKFTTTNPKITIRPDKRKLDRIRPYPEIWQRLLVKLGSLDFFTQMTLAEREAWLDTQQQDGEKSLSDVSDVMIHITQPPPVLRDSVTPEQLNQILSDSEITPTQVEKMIPKKSGSSATRHTLIFIKSFWKIVTTHQVTHSYGGIILDIVGGTVVPSGDYPELIYQVTISNGDIIGLKVDSDPSTTDKLTVYRKLITDGILTLPTEFISVSNVVEQLFHGFTSSMYKSLLQKIIRFRPVSIQHSRPFQTDQTYPAELVLTLTLVELIFHSGSFVPDIQRYVSGLESATKRLAIIGLEDSSTLDTSRLVALFGSAVLAQQVRGWRPSIGQIVQWINIAQELLANQTAYEFDTNVGSQTTPYRISALDSTQLTNNLVLSSVLLDSLRSFPGDLGMARYLAKQSESGGIIMVGQPTRPETMWFHHFLDHHCFANLVYFFPTEVLTENISSNLSTPYSTLFNRIFHQVTGVNPRRSPEFSVQDWQGQALVKSTQLAQQLAIHAIQSTQLEFSLAGGTYDFTTSLDQGWIAGMVGAIPHRASKQPTVMVTMKPQDPLQLAVMVKPARDNRDVVLSDTRQTSAIVTVEQQLRDGVTMDQVQPPISSLAKREVYLHKATSDTESDEYYIRPIGSTVVGHPWSDVRNIHMSVNMIKPVSSETPFVSYQYRTSKVLGTTNPDLSEIFSRFNRETLQRGLNVLRTFDTTIQLSSIGKSGGGTEASVNIGEIGVFQLLHQLAINIPQAIQPSKGNLLKFTIDTPPLLWKMTEQLQRYLRETSPAENDISNFVAPYPSHPVFVPIDQRKPWLHQTETVDEMYHNYQRGSSGNFLWIPAGMGKTSIVMWYLAKRLQEQSLPPYLVYTLPTSACQSVIKEIQNFNVPIQYVMPLKTTKASRIVSGIPVVRECVFNPNMINIVEHDHIVRCLPELVALGNNLLFVVDEVHKALERKTLRTGSMLEIARSSAEFIAFTGTPVINNNIYNLMEWFKMMLPFRINSNNFLVAMNSMIAKKITTGVKVHDYEITLDLGSSEWNSRREQYLNLVPTRKFGGRNHHPSNTDFIKAMDLCYQVCDTRMIQLVIENLSVGVMLVARRKRHQFYLADLCFKHGIKPDEVLVLSSTNPNPELYHTATSIFLTDDSVDTGTTPDYRVVIATITHPEGYTLSRLGCLVTGVYPSNNASREQILGRINRMSQHRSEISNYTVHTGILSFIYRHHENARNLSEALKTLATEITLPQT